MLILAEKVEEGKVTRAAVRIGFDSVMAGRSFGKVYAPSLEVEKELMAGIKLEKSYDGPEVTTYFSFTCPMAWRETQRFPKSQIRVPNRWVGVFAA